MSKSFRKADLCRTGSLNLFLLIYIFYSQYPLNISRTRKFSSLQGAGFTGYELINILYGIGATMCQASRFKISESFHLNLTG